MRAHRQTLLRQRLLRQLLPLEGPHQPLDQMPAQGAPSLRIQHVQELLSIQVSQGTSRENQANQKDGGYERHVGRSH